MRRGEMRIERHAFHLPDARQNLTLDPCVTRDGDRILLDGVEIDRSNGPIHAWRSMWEPPPSCCAC